MQVTTIKYGRTVKRGGEKSFEFDRLDVEIMPMPGQSPEDAFVSLRQCVDSTLQAWTGNSNGKTEEPVTIAKKSEQKSDPTTASQSPSTESATSDFGSTEKPKATRGKGGKKSAAQAVNVNAPDPKKELQYALDSETLPELLERFNAVSKLRGKFAEQWEAAVTQIADRYRKLNSLDADPEVLDQLVKAFKRERQKIEELKAAV